MQIDFQALFAASPNPYVVLDRSLVIVWMNEAYLATTMRERHDILGRPIFDAFPSDPSSQSHHLLSSSFERVLSTRKADEIALIRYDILNPNGKMDVRYWSATHTPLLDAEGEVDVILQHTVDVTVLQGLRAMRDEMGVVQRAQAVQARNQDLAEESGQLRALVEQAPGFVAILRGPDHRFQMANAAYRTLVGHRDLIGRTVAEALPEVVEQGFVDLLTQVRTSGTSYVGLQEMVVLQNQPDEPETERYLDFLYQPILDQDGGVSGIFIQGHDVTARVLAEEHQSLLISELNHRVKNTLAVVQSLASQSFRRAESVEAASKTFSARLMTLARAHSLLTQGNREDTGLSDAIRAEVEATAGLNAERVHISGPEVFLEADAAMSFAMIVHELSTNAIKYGALSTEHGRIDVNWTRNVAGDQWEIILDWKESGGPKVEPPARRGFGSKLIERGITSSVKSTVVMEFKPEGLHARFLTRVAGSNLETLPSPQRSTTARLPFETSS